MRENLHLYRVLQEILEVIVNENVQPLDGVRYRGQALFKARENRLECADLNQVEQLLLALNVVVEPGKRHARRTAEVTDGSAFVTFFGEDLGRRLENALKLALRNPRMSQKLTHQTLCPMFVERSFDKSRILPGFGRVKSTCHGTGNSP